MKPSRVRGRDLRLGDRVQTFEGSYSTATVIRIEKDVVTLYRPYVRADTSDTDVVRYLPRSAVAL